MTHITKGTDQSWVSWIVKSATFLNAELKMF